VTVLDVLLLSFTEPLRVAPVAVTLVAALAMAVGASVEVVKLRTGVP
jgi:hypothetical protein